MKKITAMIIVTAVLFSFAFMAYGGTETDVSVNIGDNYVISVPGTLSLANGVEDLNISVTEYHSNNLISIRISRSYEPNSTVWRMIGEAGNYIGYSVRNLANNNEAVTPNLPFSIGTGGATLRFTIEESDRRTAKTGYYSDHLVFSIG